MARILTPNLLNHVFRRFFEPPEAASPVAQAWKSTHMCIFQFVEPPEAASPVTQAWESQKMFI